MTLLKLRDYQEDALTAFTECWNRGVLRPAGVLPTGAGKTVIFAHMAERHLMAHPAERVLVLAHTDELVLQAAAKMRSVAPHRSVGIVKAERNETHAHVIVASVQSLRSAKRRAQLRNVGLVIVDECHHATATTYRTIMEDLGCFGDRVRTAGFTATLIRADKAKLSAVWEGVAFTRDIPFMIRRGYLLDVRGKRVEVPQLNLSEVRQSGGDYREGDLGEALIDALAPEIVAKAYLEHASDRKGLLFAPTVDSAYAFAAAFNEVGIKTEVVHGGLGRDERRAILARLRDGTTQVVSNCMVLTEGFDEPTVSCAVIARPTKSPGLYQQMVGRVLRPDLTLPVAERGHALILDVVGISALHGLQSLVDLSSRKDLNREEIDEDLTLLQLEDLILEETGGMPGDLPPEGFYAGPVDVRDFDPLARDSSRVWGRTPGGVYWMSAGTDRYVFLADSVAGEPGTYDVVWCAKDARGSAGLTEHRGLSFEMALSWAEEAAIEMGGYGTLTLTSKKARWRKDVPTEPQIKRARQLGITVPMDGNGVPLINKGQISEMIDDAIAAKRIDPLVQAVKSKLKAS